MSNVTANNFGLLIAYLLPGFIVLWGLSGESETLRTWLGASTADSPTVGGFLYVTLASVAAGLVMSTVRWLFLDGVHHVTGLRQPRWNFSQLANRVEAFEMLIEIHYRYYQFYGNSLVAFVLVYGLWKVRNDGHRDFGWQDMVWLLLVVLFFIGSRDTLRKYHERVGDLLGTQRAGKRGGG